MLTANLEGAKYTLAVPTYLYNEGLKSFADIAKFKDKLGGKIYGIEPGNDGNRLILDMIKDNKFGLKGFSEALRGELAAYPRVHVCDVYPSFIDTPGMRHAANYSGHKITAPPPVYDARLVAARIVRLAERPQVTATVGWIGDVIRLAHGIAPSLSARIAGGLMQAYFKRAPKTMPTQGNLFAPPAIAGGIDGGLRSSERPKNTVVILGSILAIGGLLALGARGGGRR